MKDECRYGDLSEIREKLSPAELKFESGRRVAGLFLGPLLFAVLLMVPMHGLSVQASRLAAVIAWVLVWWVTEAVPIPVTSLLGPALAVFMGVGGAKELFAAFGNPILFLFLGSFILAEAMAVHGLDRRIAFGILNLKFVGSSSGRILISFAVLSAGLSMWLSNSATTAMLYPIAMGVLAAFTHLLTKGAAKGEQRFGNALMLGTAFAASIGGIVTPVGTPPNLIAEGFLNTLVHKQIPFFQWMLLVFPIAAVMLIACLVIMHFALPAELKKIKGSGEFFASERSKLGKWKPGEKNVVFVFLLAVFLWVLPGVLAVVAGSNSALYKSAKGFMQESTVAILAASLLFILPVNWKKREFTMTWGRAVRIDWGTLMLFGGGISLGKAMFDTGLAKAIGNGITDATGATSVVALTFVFGIVGILFTEVTSNTATATMLIPLAIAAAQAAGVSPVEPAIGCALCCSMAFMLPVATPPNAIVYGSGYVRITKMIKLGFWLDLIAALVVPTGVVLLTPLVLG